jgi:glycosyltransferase involved in cell wall biosynthesis
MEPRVTILIAHKDNQHYLKGCIESALNQTYKNIHVCVIDDCSEREDLTANIIWDLISDDTTVTTSSAEYQDNLYAVHSTDKITYITLEKSEGSYRQCYARNRGVEQCWDDTDIFGILDADDEMYPTKIEKCVEVLQSDPKIGGVYTDTNIVQVADNRLVREYREPYDYYRLVQECIIHSGAVLTKQAIKDSLENGVMMDEQMPVAEDYDLWMRIAEKYLFYHIPEPLVLVRVHPQNSTATSTHDFRMQMLKRLHQKRAQRLQ